MSWVRLSDSFDDDPRIVTAGPAATGLLTMLLAFNNRNLCDGCVPLAVVRQKAIGLADADAVIAVMVKLGLLTRSTWNEIECVQIHEDFVVLQPTREQVETQRQQKADAGRLGGVKSGEARRKQTRSRTEANASADVKRNRTPDPDPDPVKKEPTAPAEPSPVGVMLTHYTTAYEKRFGAKPEISNGKDGAIIKHLIDAHGVDAVRKRIDALLMSTDTFITTTGRTIGILQSCWNKLTATSPTLQKKPRPPGCDHQPVCVNAAEHTSRWIREEREAFERSQVKAS